MAPEDIKALRQELGCSARELGAALAIEQETVLAWERGDLFPTKRFVDMMEALRKNGPSAIPKKRRKGAPAPPFQVLSDPELWKLVRKLVAHPELRAAALELSAGYPDPADAAEPRG
jgi:transcriptional regulator with XRE-family HTH domain